MSSGNLSLTSNEVSAFALSAGAIFAGKVIQLFDADDDAVMENLERVNDSWVLV